MPAGTCAASRNHFAAYDRVAKNFAQAIGIDPWLHQPGLRRLRQINFQERQGEECLAANVDAVLDASRPSTEYGVKETPFVVVKADAGTYGMGVMTVRDAAEVIGLNRKQRNKMAWSRKAWRSPR
jgi:glutamate--cysteine ligase